MRVKWDPPYTSLQSEGDVISINIIDNQEHFLLLEDAGTFRSVPAEQCILIKPIIVPDE